MTYATKILPEGGFDHDSELVSHFESNRSSEKRGKAELSREKHVRRQIMKLGSLQFAVSAEASYFGGQLSSSTRWRRLIGYISVLSQCVLASASDAADVLVDVHHATISFFFSPRDPGKSTPRTGKLVASLIALQ